MYTFEHACTHTHIPPEKKILFLFSLFLPLHFKFVCFPETTSCGVAEAVLELSTSLPSFHAGIGGGTASGPCGLTITLLRCGMCSTRHPFTLSNLVPQLVSLLPTATEHLDFLVSEAPFWSPSSHSSQPLISRLLSASPHVLSAS